MANHESQDPLHIAIHSVGEGLDFACNILAGGISHLVEQRADLAPGVLKNLCQYISFRYAGEDLLALEELVMLGRDLQEIVDVRWVQFWRQLEWVAAQMDVSIETFGTAD